jgi:hypothetical protein
MQMNLYGILIIVIVAILLLQCFLRFGGGSRAKEHYTSPTRSFMKKVPAIPLQNQMEQQYGVLQTNPSTVPRMTKEYCEYVCDTNYQYCLTPSGHPHDQAWCEQSKERCNLECKMNQYFP